MNIIKKIWLTVVEIKCTSFILKILKWMHVNFILAIALVFSRYLTLLNYSTEKNNEENIKKLHGICQLKELNIVLFISLSFGTK